MYGNVRLFLEKPIALEPINDMTGAMELSEWTNGNANSVEEAWQGFRFSMNIADDVLETLESNQRVTIPKAWAEAAGWTHVIWRVLRTVPNPETGYGNLELQGRERNYDRKRQAQLRGLPFSRYDPLCTGTPPSPYADATEEERRAYGRNVTLDSRREYVKARAMLEAGFNWKGEPLDE